MNHIYKLRFNRVLQRLTVVSELASGVMVKNSASRAGSAAVQSASQQSASRVARLSKFTLALLSLAGSPFALAGELPTGASIQAGSATLQSNSQAMVINQHSDKLITNWQTFGIGKNNSVEFKQPSASSMALNRVTGGQPSQILGSLKANGQVFLINPKGIIFGKNAQVNVGALTASTGAISNADFLKNHINITDIGNGEIINQGNLKVNSAGYIVLAASTIKNSGTLSASNGKVALAAGKAVTLYLDNNQLVSVDVSQGTLKTLIENKGLIAASNGQVYLTAKGGQQLRNTVINLGGTVDVTAIRQTDQGIFIDGGNSGVTEVSGHLLADGSAQGGKVVVTGDQVQLSGTVSATGQRGGAVYVGGGWHGDDAAIHNADKVTLTDSAHINISGRQHGGDAVLWSETATRFAGQVDFGNGGRLETSSRGQLAVTGKVNGSGGDWLLDPRVITLTDETIEGATPQTDLTNTDVTSVPATGENKNFTISVATLNSSLNQGTNVSLQADTLNVTNVAYAYSTPVDKSATLTLNATSALNIVNSSIRPVITENMGGLNVNLNGGNVSITDSVIDLRSNGSSKPAGNFTSNSQFFSAVNSTLVAGAVNITANAKSTIVESVTNGDTSWQKRTNTNAIWIKNSRIGADSGNLVINGTINPPTGSPLDLTNSSKDGADFTNGLFSDTGYKNLQDTVPDSTKITRDEIPSENAITVIDSVLQAKGETANVTLSGKSGGEFSGVRLLGHHADDKTAAATVPDISSKIGTTDVLPLAKEYFATTKYDNGGEAMSGTTASDFNGVTISATNNVTIYGESKGTSFLHAYNSTYPGIPTSGNPLTSDQYLYTVFGERGSLYLEGNITIAAKNNNLTGNNTQSNSDNLTYYPSGFAFYALNATFNGATDLNGYADQGNGIAVWSKSHMTFNNPNGLDKSQREENHVAAISQNGSGLTFVNYNYIGDKGKDQEAIVTDEGKKKIIDANAFHLNMNNADFSVYAKGRLNGFYSGLEANNSDKTDIGQLNTNSDSIVAAGYGDINAVGISDQGIGFSIKALDNTGLHGFVNITGISNTGAGLSFNSSAGKDTDGKQLLKYKVIGHDDNGTGEDNYGVNIIGYSHLKGVVISTSLTPDMQDSLALSTIRTLSKDAAKNKSTIQGLVAAHQDIAIFTQKDTAGHNIPLPNININGISTGGLGVELTNPDTAGTTINLNGVNITGISYSTGGQPAVSIASPIQIVNSHITGISHLSDGISVAGGTKTNPSMFIESQLTGYSGDTTGKKAGVNLNGNVVLVHTPAAPKAVVPTVQGGTLAIDTFSLPGLLESFNKVISFLPTDKKPATPTLTTITNYADMKPEAISINNANIFGSGTLQSYITGKNPVASVGIMINNASITAGLPTDLPAALSLGALTAAFTAAPLTLDAQGNTGAIVQNSSTLNNTFTNITLNGKTLSTSADTDSALLLSGNITLAGKSTITADNQNSTQHKPAGLNISNANITSSDAKDITITTTGIQHILDIDNSTLEDNSGASRLVITGVIANLATGFPATKTVPLIHIGNATLNNTDIKVNGAALTQAVPEHSNITLFNLTPGAASTSYDKLTLNNSTLNFTGNSLTGFRINNDIKFENGGKIIADVSGDTSPLSPSIVIGDTGTTSASDHRTVTLTGDVTDINAEENTPNIQLTNNAWLLINNNASDVVSLNNMVITGSGNTHIEKPNPNSGNLQVKKSSIINTVNAATPDLTYTASKKTDLQPDAGILLNKINLYNSLVNGTSANAGVNAVVLKNIGTVTNSTIRGTMPSDLSSASADKAAAVTINNDNNFNVYLTMLGSNIEANGPLNINLNKAGLKLNSYQNTPSKITATSYSKIAAPYIGSEDAKPEESKDPANSIKVNVNDDITLPTGIDKDTSAWLTLANSNNSSTLLLTNLFIDANNGTKEGNTLAHEIAFPGTVEKSFIKIPDTVTISGAGNLTENQGGVIQPPKVSSVDSSSGSSDTGGGGSSSGGSDTDMSGSSSSSGGGDTGTGNGGGSSSGGSGTVTGGGSSSGGSDTGTGGGSSSGGSGTVTGGGSSSGGSGTGDVAPPSGGSVTPPASGGIVDQSATAGGSPVTSVSVSSLPAAVALQYGQANAVTSGAGINSRQQFKQLAAPASEVAQKTLQVEICNVDRQCTAHDLAKAHPPASPVVTVSDETTTKPSARRP